MGTLKARDGIENTPVELTEEEDQLSYSVFAQSMKRTETQMNMLTGAFYEESDDEKEQERKGHTSEGSLDYVASIQGFAGCSTTPTSGARPGTRVTTTRTTNLWSQTPRWIN
jgi:hypothetical protein